MRQLLSFTQAARSLARQWLVVLGVMLGLIIGLMLIIPAVASLVSTVQTQNAKAYLPTAKQQWQAANITHYQVELGIYGLWMVPGFAGFSDSVYFCAMNQDVLTVKDGQLVGAREMATCGPIYAQLTLEGAFALAEKYTQTGALSLNKLEFDPDYGYILALDLQPLNSSHFVSLRYTHLVILEP